MDVCAKLRGVLRERRIGHAGTLDPMATGVLPVFVGRATRAVDFAVDTTKEYVAGLRLGLVTDTQDTEGRVLDSRPAGVSEDRLREIMGTFTGPILQVPPMYSAIKVGGRKLYQLAREGKEVERMPRPVTVYALELLGREANGDFLLRIECSKGAYMRTLCHDIGQALGCGGCMSSLRRTRAAGFTVEEAVPLAEAGEAALLPVDQFFARIGWEAALTVPPEAEKLLRNGGTALAPGTEAACRAVAACRVYGESGEFLGIGGVTDGRLRLTKSFYEV